MKLCAGSGLEVFEESLDGCLAKISQKPALVLEEDAEHFWDGEDDLAVRDIQKKLLSHPLAPLLKPLGVAGRTKSSGVTGEHQEAFLPTVGTADAGKSATGVTAVEIALDHLLDDGPEETVLLLETSLILGQELVKIMEHHPVEHGTFRMSGTIDSCHSREEYPGNRPEECTRSFSPGNDWMETGSDRRGRPGCDR